MSFTSHPAPALAVSGLIGTLGIYRLGKTLLDEECELCRRNEGKHQFSGCSYRIFRICAEAKPLFFPSKGALSASFGYVCNDALADFLEEFFGALPIVGCYFDAVFGSGDDVEFYF